MIPTRMTLLPENTRDLGLTWYVRHLAWAEMSDSDSPWRLFSTLFMEVDLTKRVVERLILLSRGEVD
jgi:hypothetical protein